MTHTNHRFGDAADLEDDLILLAMPAKGINDGPQGVEKLRKIFEMLLRFTPVNGGGMNAGILITDPPSVVLCRIGPDTPMIHAVFPDHQVFANALRVLAEARLGLSVVATGPLEQVNRLAGKAGLTRHSVNLSLGILGKRELLPPPEILAVTTMCGHGMIGPVLVERLLEDLAAQRVDLDSAVREMGRQCVCGVFNPHRAVRLLRRALAVRQNEGKTGEPEKF